MIIHLDYGIQKKVNNQKFCIIILISYRTSHTFPVTCCKVLDDRLFSGSLDQTLRAWDLEVYYIYCFQRCTQLAVLVGHQGGLTQVEANESRVVTSSEDCTIKIWDRNTRNCDITLKDHTDTVTCFQVYKNILQCNDIYVVSGSEDSTIKIWDLRKSTSSPILTLLGHSGKINSLQFDSTKILSASSDSTVRLWDFTTGECIYVGNEHEGPVYQVAFEGNTVVTAGDDGDVVLWKSNTGSLY